MREFGRVNMMGETMLPVYPETLSENYPYLRGEGLNINYSVERGATISADEAEARIRRLYEHIERLTTANVEGIE